MLTGVIFVQDPGMSKRLLAAILWFSATWFGYEILWSMTDAPRLVGPILAFVVAAAVTIDPMRLFWPGRADDRVESLPSGSAVAARS